MAPCVLATSGSPIKPARELERTKSLSPAYGQELDRIERAAFGYLWEQRDARSGLVYNTTEKDAPASPTAAGIVLSAIPIGIERGWITREQGYKAAEKLLEAANHADQVKGFYYHFLDRRSGKRTWNSEVSCIDSAILFAGAMVVADYFRTTALDRLANRLIGRAAWPWFMDGQESLKWSWSPESGFKDVPMDFSESVLAYLLALGSPTHPIPPDAWDAMRRPITYVGGDVNRKMVYTSDGSLFAYLLPLAWFDLRGKHDAYLDYWTNARTAILANIQFSRKHKADFLTYRKGLWGLSASIGPDGYKAYGAEPAAHIIHDGTVAPYIVAASMPWFPERSLSSYLRMEKLIPTESLIPYGLGDALNLDRKYYCRFHIVLDEGLALLMIENMRTGLIWDIFMRHPVAKRALEIAGFVPGGLKEPLVPKIIPGNPGASMSVPMIDHAVSIDADLQEWIKNEAIELTPKDRRSVESGVVRDSKDASALFYVGWSERYFYISGIVQDDELVARYKKAKIYKDDCVEVFWDLDGDGFRFDGNKQDVQIGLAPVGGAKSAWQLWAWGALNRRPRGVKAATGIIPGGYIFELAVPMKLLPGLPEREGARFSVAVHDRDRDGMDAKLNWSIDTASKPGTILFGRINLETSS